MQHVKWSPTQVRTEIFKELDARTLGKKERSRLEILMAQTDIVIEEIISGSRTSIFDDFHKADAKGKAKILSYLFKQI